MASTPTLDDINTLFDQWFAQTCFGGVVARNTEVYNFLFEAKDKFKASLVVAFGPNGPAPSSAFQADSTPNSPSSAKSSGAN